MALLTDVVRIVHPAHCDLNLLLFQHEYNVRQLLQLGLEECIKVHYRIININIKNNLV